MVLIGSRWGEDRKPSLKFILGFAVWQFESWLVHLCVWMSRQHWLRGCSPSFRKDLRSPLPLLWGGLADWKYSRWKVLITVATFKVWCYDLGWSGPPISGRCCGCCSLTGAIPKQLTSQSSLRRPFCALTGDPGCIWLPWNTCSSVSPLSWEFRWCRFSNCIVALLMHTKFLPALASVVVFSVPGFKCAVAAQTQSWPRRPDLECEQPLCLLVSTDFNMAYHGCLTALQQKTEVIYQRECFKFCVFNFKGLLGRAFTHAYTHIHFHVNYIDIYQYSTL